MKNYDFLKKPIKYSYTISGYLSLNEILYDFVYKMQNIKDENKLGDIEHKIKLMYKFISIRFILLLSFSLSLVLFQDMDITYKCIIYLVTSSHILYLLIWQIAYFFKLSNYIDDISREELDSSDELIFSLINFFEIIICFSIIFLLIFNNQNITDSITEISHLYFSFSNLTTLNGGDIYTPKTYLSQLLSIIEAMVGVLYLIINFPILIQNTHKLKNDN